MAVSLVHCRIGREAVEITIALRIPHKDAFAARQNDTERLVVLGAEARFRRDEIRDRWTHLFVTSVAANWHQLGSPISLDQGHQSTRVHAAQLSKSNNCLHAAREGMRGESRLVSIGGQRRFFGFL